MKKQVLSFLRLHKTVRSILTILLIAALLLPFEFFLYKIFSRRALSFGCFDDCSNYLTGYFMLNGKVLYSEIFNNHIMGMSYLSFVIQKLHHSINLYDLILTHRQAIMVFAFVMDVLLIKRFKWAGVIFVVLYELSKFYVFGDRFLGESIVVYAAVFLVGCLFEKYNGHKLSLLDYLLSGFFTWLILFMREPYIPLALFLFGVILWGKIERKKMLSLGVFLLLTLIVAVNTNISDFYFNDVTVNLMTAIKGEASTQKLFGVGFFEIFFYPIYLLVIGKWNMFRLFLICIDMVFLAGICYQFFVKKKRILVLLIFFLLGLSNLRLTVPGTVYFEAYHLMVWYGIFLFTSALLLQTLFYEQKKLGIVLLIILLGGWSITIFSPSSYLFDKVDQQEQLLTNFGTVMNVGNVIRYLSAPGDTVFLDGADDMIIWQSGLITPYKYSWYTGVMPQIPQYREARIEMFKKSPPDFYYDFCSPQAPFHTSLPKFIRSKYQQLYSNGKKSCLYVLKSDVKTIQESQWEHAKEGFYDLPQVKPIDSQ